jgi:hypothetical protein
MLTSFSTCGKIFENFAPRISEKNDERKKHMKTVTNIIYSAFAVVILAIGAVTANGAVNDLFASVNGSGFNGGGFIYQYTSTGVQSIFASGLSRPRGVAFDHFSNLFVATNTFDSVSGNFTGAIVKIAPDGTQTTFANVNGPSSSFFLEDLKIDSSGNVFVAAQDNNDPNGATTIYKFTSGGLQSTFAAPPPNGAQIFGLTVDAANNLYVLVNFDDGSPPQIWKFLPDGTPSVIATASDSHFGLIDLAIDRFGNFFVSTLSPLGRGQDLVLKYTPNGTESTFAMGLNDPRGLAFDRGGNLFVAEIIQTGPGDILKFTPGGVETVFASGIGPGGNGGPEFLAFQLLPTPRPRPTPAPRP